MGERKCKYCGKSILYIRTQGGKYMPVDADPVYYKERADGKDYIVLPNGEVVRGKVIRNEYAATGIGYISHFATCTKYKNPRRTKNAPTVDPRQLKLF